MKRIGIRVSGDHWCNADEVIDAIAGCAGDNSIVFEVNTEGPSLHALGIVETIQSEISKIGITKDQIWIDKWHNTVEQVPFHRAYRPLLSHFFWLSEKYRSQQPDPTAQEKVFGLFVGRVTPDRAVILYELYHMMPNEILVSLMLVNGHEKMLQKDLSTWLLDPKQQQILRHWFYNPPVTSLTGHKVRDQYEAGNNTNADLIKYYNKFAVEIVCETYCLGDTFFPTEKTVRPLTQSKPMIVYGPRHFLRRLQNLGFQTWGDIWDESYDELEGPERWVAIKQILGPISKKSLWNHRLIEHKAKINLSVLDYLIAKHRPG
jgi:hypothetical protein